MLHRLGIRRDAHLVAIRDPRWEDACSEVVLALIEGRDPVEAARDVMATEKRHAARTVAFGTSISSPWRVDPPARQDFGVSLRGSMNGIAAVVAGHSPPSGASISRAVPGFESPNGTQT